MKIDFDDRESSGSRDFLKAVLIVENVESLYSTYFRVGKHKEKEMVNMF